MGFTSTRYRLLFSKCSVSLLVPVQEDGLVGTGAQQLQLLAYYAECCEDFRRYQRLTREASALPSEGAQLVLLSGPPGCGKTRHAVSFAKALGMPLWLGSCLRWRLVGFGVVLLGNQRWTLFRMLVSGTRAQVDDAEGGAVGAVEAGDQWPGLHLATWRGGAWSPRHGGF